MRTLTVYRALRLAVVLLGLGGLFVAGIKFPVLRKLPNAYIFWTGWGLLAATWLCGGPLLARWRLSARIRAALPASGELTGMAAAAVAIKQGQAERALYILENLTIRTKDPDVIKARRWLAALAGARVMAKAGRPHHNAHPRFPQLQALVFCHWPRQVALRPQVLARELSEASSPDLDALAADYINLVDILVASAEDPGLPFAEEAEELLAFTTGQVFLFGGRERYREWWERMRPVLTRGGGALIAGARLLQRECFAEAAALLSNLAREGLLSDETETLRRAAQFMAFFHTRPRGIGSAEIPRYFGEGFYCRALETGVLCYPTAELDEVAACCRRGKILRESKRRMIEDTLALWDGFGACLAPLLAGLLKRLMDHKGRKCPLRARFWWRQWEGRKEEFERPTALLMEGIAAVSAGRLNEAARTFEEVSRLEPGLSLPLVNLVHVKLLLGMAAEARELAARIEQRFPSDGGAMLALGRLLAMHLEDTSEAERLFCNALRLLDPPTEAFINLGELKRAEGMYMEAQAYFDHAKQLDPNLPQPKIGLARTYLETRNFRQAIENLNAVARESSGEARDLAHYLLYRAYREMGEDRRAFECLDRVPRRFFKEPDTLDDIANHLESEHRYAQAREFSERAMILRAGGSPPQDDADALSI